MFLFLDVYNVLILLELYRLLLYLIFHILNGMYQSLVRIYHYLHTNSKMVYREVVVL